MSGLFKSAGLLHLLTHAGPEQDIFAWPSRRSSIATVCKGIETADIFVTGSLRHMLRNLILMDSGMNQIGYSSPKQGGFHVQAFT